MTNYKQPFHATLKEARETCKSFYEDSGQLRGCTCGTCPAKTHPTGTTTIKEIVEPVKEKWGFHLENGFYDESEVNEFWESINSAFKDYGDVVRQKGYEKGWDRGFDAGVFASCVEVGITKDRVSKKIESRGSTPFRRGQKHALTKVFKKLKALTNKENYDKQT